MDDNSKQSQKDLLGACSLDRACPAAAVVAVAEAAVAAVAVQTVLAAAAVGVAVVVYVAVVVVVVVVAVVVVSSLAVYCHAGSTQLDDSHLSCEKTKVC